MFAGHAAAVWQPRDSSRASTCACSSPRLGCSIVLWVFVLAGPEAVAIPADFAHTQQPEFGLACRTACSPALLGRSSSCVRSCSSAGGDRATRDGNVVGLQRRHTVARRRVAIEAAQCARVRPAEECPR